MSNIESLRHVYQPLEASSAHLENADLVWQV